MQRREFETAGAWRRVALPLILPALMLPGQFAIRAWGFEVFHVVSSSMSPTLGGLDERAAGDRILVFKGPAAVQRFDVIAYRTPWRRTQTFVGRVAGLPGEEFAIERGNLWSRAPGEPRFRIARMPQPVWIEMPDRFYQRGSTLKDGEQAVADLDTADDLRLTAHMDLPEGGTTTLSISGGMGRATLQMSASPTIEWSDGRRSVRQSLPRAVAGLHTIELAIHDGVAWVSVDGRRAAEIVFLSTDDELPPEDRASEASIRHAGPPMNVRSLRVDRGIRWEGKRNVEDGLENAITIPPDSYVVLGDNQMASHDSRRWSLLTFRFKDGRTLTCESLDVQDDRTGRADLVAHDEEGRDVSIFRRDVERLDPPPTPAPFIRREHIVGRVVEIVWPPDRAGPLKR